MNEAAAIVALIKSLKWTYVSVLHSSSEQSMKKLKTIEVAMDHRSACMALKLEVNTSRTDNPYYNNIVYQLNRMKGAVGVIVLLTASETRHVLEAVQRTGILGRFIWIGTDQWGSNTDLVQDLEEVVRGALTVAPDVGTDPYFDMYMGRVRLNIDDHNPWLKKFWQEHFQCDLKYGVGYGKVCTGAESLENFTFSDNPHTINTINAVYAYAYGITKLFKERFGGMVVPPCDALRGGDATSRLVHEYIKNTHFVGADQKPFSFTKQGDGPGRVKVFSYHGNEAGNVSAQYVQVSVCRPSMNLSGLVFL